jgi:hypothetical protein
VVRTNHNSLQYFLEQKDLNERQQKWVRKIQEYDFDIEYVKVKKNIFFNALFGKSVVSSLMEISTNWKSHLLVEYSKNQFSCELMDDHIEDGRYKVVDDIILYKDGIYLVPESTLKENILRAIDDTQLAGHPSYLKTYR